MRAASELQEGELNSLTQQAGSFLMLQIFVFPGCEDALRTSAEIRQTSSASPSRKCHWLLVLGHRTSLWAKLEAVGDLARVVWSLFCCLVCFHSWWDLGLPSKALLKNAGLEATFTPRWDVCGVRTPRPPCLLWEGRLVLGILARLVVPWASVATNCLQDLEMHCHESRIQQGWAEFPGRQPGVMGPAEFS